MTEKRCKKGVKYLNGQCFEIYISDFISATSFKITVFQIQSYFWSVFSCITTEYRKIRTRKNSVFGHFSCSVLLASFQFLTSLRFHQKFLYFCEGKEYVKRKLKCMYFNKAKKAFLETFSDSG